MYPYLLWIIMFLLRQQFRAQFSYGWNNKTNVFNIQRKFSVHVCRLEPHASRWRQIHEGELWCHRVFLKYYSRDSTFTSRCEIFSSRLFPFSSMLKCIYKYRQYVVLFFLLGNWRKILWARISHSPHKIKSFIWENFTYKFAWNT